MGIFMLAILLLYLQVLTENTPKDENFTNELADNILPPNASMYLCT